MRFKKANHIKIWQVLHSLSVKPQTFSHFWLISGGCVKLSICSSQSGWWVKTTGQFYPVLSWVIG